MLQVSSRTEYGMRCLLRLAEHGDETTMSLAEIAKCENVPKPYAEQILLRLKRAGLVKSVRGTQGGFALAMAPGLITVGAVVRVLEGTQSEHLCDHFNRKTSCGQTTACNLRSVWDLVSQRVWQTLDRITLDQLRRDGKTPAEQMTQLPVLNFDVHSPSRELH